MQKEQMREKWEEVCFHLSDDVSSNINEDVYEQKVLLVLEKLGWSRFRKEIKFRPSLQVGRQNYITPDIVICAPSDKAAIVLEIKRPAEKITKNIFINQLTSYMRQTKADFGLLIGSEIHVFYDGNLNPFPDAIQLYRIPFLSHASEGIDFIELFSRDNFSQENYEKNVEEAKQIIMLMPGSPRK